MVGGGDVPEPVRRVLGELMQGARGDQPDRALVYRELTYCIGLECRERFDAEWWEALCVGCAFDIEAGGGDLRWGDVQFMPFGGDGAVPFDLREKYPHPTLPSDLPDEVADLWRLIGRDESLHPALQACAADLMLGPQGPHRWGALVRDRGRCVRAPVRTGRLARCGSVHGLAPCHHHRCRDTPPRSDGWLRFSGTAADSRVAGSR